MMLEFVALLAKALTLTTALAAPTPPPAPEPAVFGSPTTARMAFKSYTMTLVGTAPTNGDNDGYADAGETVDLAPTLINTSGMDLTNLVIRLVTYDPTIACIGTYEVTVPAAAAGATFTAPPFRFTVGDSSVVNRSNIDELIQATFDLRIHADQFEQLASPIGFTLPLDLSASGGSGTSAYVENFEIGGTNYGKFTLQTLDAGKNSLVLSDGMRCQANDPDAPNQGEPDRPDCFLGFAGDPSQGVNDWHIHDATPSSGGVGRAYTGSKSLHWGVHNSVGTPKRDTARLKQLDAVKAISPINLPLANVAPELVFAHQISLVDERAFPSLRGEAADRAVVEVNVLTAAGLETPIWHKLDPYLNTYDVTGNNSFANCAFDPTDDGNNEDSFFDPADPERVYGPSSTCYPERVFACAGNTDYHVTATAGDICRAGDGPGLAGSVDVGTWVQPRISLQQFAGRRIRIRFLATSLEGGVVQNWESGFFNRDDFLPDDGWYIDDVRVNQALGIAMTVTADTKAITPLPCPLCNSITAALTATPGPGVPGTPVTLDAGGSVVNACPTSPPTYQFWIDGNENGIAGDAGDALVQDSTEEPSLVLTPYDSHRYAVKVRCPSFPACDATDGSDTATAHSTVECPTGVSNLAFAQTIYVDRSSVHWAVPDLVDVLIGALIGSGPFPFALTTIRDAQSFTGTVDHCLIDGPSTNGYSAWDPPLGSAYYFLVRARTVSAACPGAPASFTTNAPSERPGRDAEIVADPNLCF